MCERVQDVDWGPNTWSSKDPEFIKRAYTTIKARERDSPEPDLTGDPISPRFNCPNLMMWPSSESAWKDLAGIQRSLQAELDATAIAPQQQFMFTYRLKGGSPHVGQSDAAEAQQVPSLRCIFQLL